MRASPAHPLPPIIVAGRGTQGLRYSVWPAEGQVFPKLRLKYKPNLISLAGGMEALPITDPAARATPLEPERWRDMIARAKVRAAAPPSQRAASRPGLLYLDDDANGPVLIAPDLRCNASPACRQLAPHAIGAFRARHAHACNGAVRAPQDEGIVVLDVRNDYEWDAGHFEGAGRPQVGGGGRGQGQAGKRLYSTLHVLIFWGWGVGWVLACQGWGMRVHGVEPGRLGPAPGGCILPRAGRPSMFRCLLPRCHAGHVLVYTGVLVLALACRHPALLPACSLGTLDRGC